VLADDTIGSIELDAKAPSAAKRGLTRSLAGGLSRRLVAAAVVVF
jgi:hypothetical protein